MCCQLNAARRIDRQLAGRCARQGDPGSVETWLSLDAPVLRARLPAPLRAILNRQVTRCPSGLVRSLARLAQRLEERHHRHEGHACCAPIVRRSALVTRGSPA